jgi:hypothetical protein
MWTSSQAEKAFALLERGLGRYAIKDGEPKRSRDHA